MGIEAIDNVLQNLDFFVLTFIRVTALILSSPIFGRRNIPNIAKIALCLCLTYIVYIANPLIPAFHINSVIEYVMLCFTEMLFGLIMGYVTTLFFSIVYTSGFYIDMQMGFGMVNIFDAQSNISAPVSGTIMNIIMIVVFFGVDGHHQLISILMRTFQSVPAGMVQLDLNMAVTALDVFITAFILSVNVALPFLASGLITEVVMGFIVRMTPQMNVFVVGLPLKVLVGLSMLSIVVPIYTRFTGTLFQEMFAAIEYMLRGMVKLA